MINNPILKTLNENDIVMIEVPSTERSDLKQICRIYNLKFEDKDDEYNFSWLKFDGEVLYTNTKLHKSMLNNPIGNCTAITEKIDLEHLEQIARINDMWKSDMYLLSDKELEYRRNTIMYKLDLI